MSTKKYEFTGETITLLNGTILHRIRLLVDILNFESGSLGGWIEKEENLSQYGNAWVFGDAKVFGDAWVHGNAEVSGDAEISGNAEVYERNHILVVGPIGSRNSYTTFFRNSDNGISVSCGCFLGTLDDFLSKVKSTHRDSRHAIIYKAAADLAELQILN